MTSSLPLLVLLAPAAQLLVALWARRHPGRPPVQLLRAAQATAGAGLLIACAGIAAIALRGPLHSTPLGWAGLGPSARLDPLSGIMLATISLLGVVVVRYSITYLAGDPRHGAFLGRLAALTAAVQVFAVAGDLATIVIGWVATGAALHRLLRFYDSRPRAIAAARKRRSLSWASNGLLVIGAVALHQRFGTGELEVLLAAVPEELAGGWSFGSLELAMVCIALAAALTSAQLPTYGWLVEVVEAPTPVSALLHAGVLNAGPYLVLRLAGAFDGAEVANALLIVVGGATALVASVALLTQTSIKVVLAHSSAAHMGFMLLICGAGIYPAAFLHLVAHSAYKAHAFLAAGSVVGARHSAALGVPARRGALPRIVASVAVAGGLYLAGALSWVPAAIEKPELLAIGAVLVLGLTQLLAPTLDSEGPVVAVAGTVAMAAAVIAAFLGLEALAQDALGTTVPGITGRSDAHLVLLGAVVAAFAVATFSQAVHPTARPAAWRRRLAIHLRNGLYANAATDRLLGTLRTGGR